MNGNRAGLHEICVLRVVESVVGSHIGRFLPSLLSALCSPSQARLPYRMDGASRTYLCDVIEQERAPALDVKIPAPSERVVGADQDLLSPLLLNTLLLSLLHQTSNVTRSGTG